MKFILHLLISAFSLGFASYVIPGIHINNLFTLFVAAFIMGIVNSVLKPILIILTLPFTIVTFGLFLLIVNALLFAFVAWLLPGFTISSFTAAFLGWLLVSFTSWIATKLFGI